MPTFLITHRRMEPSVHGGKHIGWVRLSDGTTLSREQVLGYIRRGVAFYTRAPITGHEARVVPGHCRYCGLTYVTTEPDAWKDDNLDNLPTF